MTTINLDKTTSDRDFAAIKRTAENVVAHWPEFSGATISVVRDGDGVSVDGCDELAGAKLHATVCGELDILRDTFWP
jgi:hypothetical protein